jgi:hypothetical protein
LVGFGTRGGALGDAAGVGEEIVVPEATAAFLVRQRAVDIVEVIHAPASEEPRADQPE